VGPREQEERLRPERGAGGKSGVAGPPSESERGWGPASRKSACGPSEAPEGSPA
jgi:hypothetical protein